MKQSDPPPPRRRPRKLKIPRREPSVVIPVPVPFYPSPDKITCAECTCYPKEEPYQKPKKLNPCQHSPLTLYELAATVVDTLKLPPAFQWSEEDVANWCEETLSLPQYRACMLENHIDGMRLLMFEDPSKLPEINVHNSHHIQIITNAIRKEYGMDFVRFTRSITLPPRRPLQHCMGFKSRTGPSWGIRKNWTRGDILRWMKVLMPAPGHRDHWDMVWYSKPDFPSVKFARILKPKSQVQIPHYKKPPSEDCAEYQIPRKFKLQTGIPDEEQLIWIERRLDPREMALEAKNKKEKKKSKFLISKDSRLVPKKVTTEGLTGDALILARRKMPKYKFFP